MNQRVNRPDEAELWGLVQFRFMRQGRQKDHRPWLSSKQTCPYLQQPNPEALKDSGNATCRGEAQYLCNCRNPAVKFVFFRISSFTLHPDGRNVVEDPMGAWQCSSRPDKSSSKKYINTLTPIQFLSTSFSIQINQSPLLDFKRPSSIQNTYFEPPPNSQQCSFPPSSPSPLPPCCPALPSLASAPRTDPKTPLVPKAAAALSAVPTRTATALLARSPRASPTSAPAAVDCLTATFPRNVRMNAKPSLSLLPLLREDVSPPSSRQHMTEIPPVVSLLSMSRR